MAVTGRERFIIYEGNGKANHLAISEPKCVLLAAKQKASLLLLFNRLLQVSVFVYKQLF